MTWLLRNALDNDYMQCVQRERVEPMNGTNKFSTRSYQHECRDTRVYGLTDVI